MRRAWDPRQLTLPRQFPGLAAMRNKLVASWSSPRWIDHFNSLSEAERAQPRAKAHPDRRDQSLQIVRDVIARPGNCVMRGSVFAGMALTINADFVEWIIACDSLATAHADRRRRCARPFLMNAANMPATAAVSNRTSSRG
jgi:hypothetical protein